MKSRVLILVGGKSGEHEVSLRSGFSVLRYLDRERFEVDVVGISKKGKWYLQNPHHLEAQLDQPRIQSLTLDWNGQELPLTLGSTGLRRYGWDVVFPLVHGKNGEDGTLQGLLELLDMPYVGCGVVGSAVGMDKEMTKRLVEFSGIKTVPWITLRKTDTALGASALDGLEKKIHEKLGGFPVFLKPSAQGSSVGVHKVKESAQLVTALKDAFQFDEKFLLEKAIPAREIEFSVLQAHRPGDAPRVSVAGEIIPQHEFYSYEAKYLDDNGAILCVPADLPAERIEEGKQLAAQVFELLECEGMARVDFFLDKDTGTFYLNEVNTIPGFTSISMYPKLFEASGLAYSALLSELLDLAMERHARRSSLRYERN